MTLDKINKKAILLVNLILGQAMVFIVLTLYQFFWSYNFYLVKQISKETITIIFLLVSIILSTTTLILFNEIISLTKKEAESKLGKQRLQDSQEMVQVLRANQHDFINHLQVIYSAAQLGKIEVAEEYIQGIVKQVRELSSISKICFPEIAALIYSKIAKADELSAKTTIIINTDLSNINMTTIDLSRVLGNLLDNALFAIEEVEFNKRELTVKIIEDQQGFKFTIFNRYPIIPEALQGQIFKPGFTTKGDKGSGLGLYNVKNLVNKYQGEIELISNIDDGTSFIVSIKK